MNSVPLIQNVDKDSINTTIIAIKKAINEIESVLGLDSGSDIDTSVFVKKSEVVDAVEADNLNPVTSNAVADYTVDRIEVNNSQPVTSNAVYEALKYKDDWVRGQVVLTDKFFEGHRLKNYWTSVVNSSAYEVNFYLPEVPINVVELRIMAQDSSNNVIRDGYSDGGYVLRCAYMVSDNRVRVNWTGWSILNSISMYITYR